MTPPPSIAMPCSTGEDPGPPGDEERYAAIRAEEEAAAAAAAAAAWEAYYGSLYDPSLYAWGSAAGGSSTFDLTHGLGYLISGMTCYNEECGTEIEAIQTYLMFC